MFTALNILFRMGCLFFDSKRCCLVSFVLLCIYFYKVENHLQTELRSNSSSGAGILPFVPSNETFPCTSASTCSIDVKMLFSDFPTCHILLPIASIIFDYTKSAISDVNLILVCFLHLGVSAMAGKLVSDKESIITRRMGVLVFQLQNFIHTMEEVMARSRIYEMGSLTKKKEEVRFYFDIVSSASACLFLLIGCYFYLKSLRAPPRPPRRKVNFPPPPRGTPLARYRRFEDFRYQSSSSEDEEGIINAERQMKPSVAHPKQTTILFAVQTLFCCIGWNYYVGKFSSVLEISTVSPTTRALQGAAVQSTSFWIIVEFWKLMSHQNMFQILLMGIFRDEMGDYMTWINRSGYLGLIITCYLSQRYYDSIQELLQL